MFRHATHAMRAWSTLACALVLAAAHSHAQVTLRANRALPFTGGANQLIGDLAAAGNDTAAAVFSQPEGTALRLRFCRFGPNAEVLAERQHTLGQVGFYTPTLCYDGQNFAVVASTFTQATFLILSPAGDILAGPVQLPGLPTGDAAGRTAAMKVVWTGQGYAVFGLWLERQYRFQELTQGNFYTHLHYWLLDGRGQTSVHRELQFLAPMTYPGIEGAEKIYYDVAWTGARFFLAYYSESLQGPPLSSYYRLYDLQGNCTRAEAPVFANQAAQGPRLAWNGRTVGLTALKAITLPSPAAGNYMYFRTFDPDGLPRGIETEYGQKLGFGPTLCWDGEKFLTVYCAMYDFAKLGYGLWFTPFDETGRRLAADYPLRGAQGVVLGHMAIGYDLQLASAGATIFGKAQGSDAYGLKNNPLVLALNANLAGLPVLAIARRGNAIDLQWPASPAGYALEETPTLSVPQWKAVNLQPTVQNGRCVLGLPIESARFYRLAR